MFARASRTTDSATMNSAFLVVEVVAVAACLRRLLTPQPLERSIYKLGEVGRDFPFVYLIARQTCRKFIGEGTTLLALFLFYLFFFSFVV